MVAQVQLRRGARRWTPVRSPTARRRHGQSRATRRCRQATHAGPPRRRSASRAARRQGSVPGRWNLRSRQISMRVRHRCFAIARCRLKTRRRGACPTCALRGIARRQVTAEHDDPVEPVERVLEIAQTRVRLGAIEARLDQLLVAYLTRHTLLPARLVKRLKRQLGSEIDVAALGAAPSRRDFAWLPRRTDEHAPLLDDVPRRAGIDACAGQVLEPEGLRQAA